jgi:hypothetical protein
MCSQEKTRRSPEPLVGDQATGAFKEGGSPPAKREMEIQQAAVALLAALVLVLGGIVGWLYWQQQRLFQNMNAMVAAIGELATRPAVPITFPEPAAEEPAVEEAAKPETEDEDDRVSVEELPEVQIVSGPPAALDTDGLESKSKKELQDILTKRGIPFGKGDNKSALISLLKATA